MSRKKLLIYGLSLFIMCSSAFAYTLHTQANQQSVTGSAGSVDDPLVTKSYVDEQIKKLLQDASLIKNEPEETKPGKDEANKEPSISNGAMEMIVLQLQKGQTLYGGAGAEFVVRTGSAKVFTSDQNGIADLTAGRDLLNDEEIPLNHLLLFPRDGRAIQADTQKDDDIYVIVRGSYILLDSDGKNIEPSTSN